MKTYFTMSRYIYSSLSVSTFALNKMRYLLYNFLRKAINFYNIYTFKGINIMMGRPFIGLTHCDDLARIDHVG